MGCKESVNSKYVIAPKSATLQNFNDIQHKSILSNDDHNHHGDNKKDSVISNKSNRQQSNSKNIRQNRKHRCSTIASLTQSITLETGAPQIDIRPSDLYAFNDKFVKQRQAAIDNIVYRTTIDSWPEGVFRTRKGVCAGYGNIFKRLCDNIGLECVKIGGYAKGYGFDPKATLLTETDHAWNSVQIDNHWYLIESTWGAGSLDDNRKFNKKLNTYYFLSRPEEFIYNHLPEEEKWQLLASPITMKQYMTLPAVWPQYFKFKLEIVHPKSNIVQLLNNESYTTIQIRAPVNVELIGSLKLGNEKIKGGAYVRFDSEQHLWFCYFAPPSTGFYEIMIYAKEKSNSGFYPSAIQFNLEVINLTNPISFPKISEKFDELKLAVIQPTYQHTLKLENGATHTKILLFSLLDILLIANLTNSVGEEVVGGHEIFFDKEKHIWQCLFAPQTNGFHEISIYGKKQGDIGAYSSVITYGLEVFDLTEPISFPETFKPYYDLGLEVVQPKFQHTLRLKDNTSHIQILIQAPLEIDLIADLTNCEGEKVSGGYKVYFDKRSSLWRCLFAPQESGLHKINIYAKKKSMQGNKYAQAIKFNFDVKQAPTHPTSYPKTTSYFYHYDLHIIAPNNSRFSVWPQNASYTEILLRAPMNIQLSGDIKYNNRKIENGSLLQYDCDKDLWQCLFAPQNIGLHKITIYAKWIAESDVLHSVVEFDMDVTHLKRSTTFPQTYSHFYQTKCKIYEPLEDNLKRGSTVTLHYRIPDADKVRIKSGSEWLTEGGYEKNIFKRQIVVSNENITIMASYKDDNSFHSLIVYTMK
ncbi:unnamed protein product [Didymodactylos carnosus]|uniref:Transglutaminase-like domain-containing protein n=1 Tax=Didymodactylos carnosus TaxID=1234261 RepID=A0A814HVB1_9BILA|nr:unnamed protein product [Didymodactylos carnosus]CAF3787575.1 unnamed protein product [Didymodactylos carnosus]